MIFLNEAMFNENEVLDDVCLKDPGEEVNNECPLAKKAKKKRVRINKKQKFKE